MVTIIFKPKTIRLRSNDYLQTEDYVDMVMIRRPKDSNDYLQTEVYT